MSGLRKPTALYKSYMEWADQRESGESDGTVRSDTPSTVCSPFSGMEDTYKVPHLEESSKRSRTTMERNETPESVCSPVGDSDVPCAERSPVAKRVRLEGSMTPETAVSGNSANPISYGSGDTQPLETLSQTQHTNQGHDGAVSFDDVLNNYADSHVDFVNIKAPEPMSEQEILKIADYTQYQQCRQYKNAPINIAEVNFRLFNWGDVYPKSCYATSKHTWYYVDAVLCKVDFTDEAIAEYNASKDVVEGTPPPEFVVLWAGCPTKFATIEPLSNIRRTNAYSNYLLRTTKQIVGTQSRGMDVAIRTPTPNSVVVVDINPQLQRMQHVSYGAGELRLLFDSAGWDSLSGLVGDNRMQLLQTEYSVWLKFLEMCEGTSTLNCNIFRKFCGYYFGSSSQGKSVAVTSIVLSKPKEFVKTIRATMSTVPFAAAKRKYGIYLIVSKKGKGCAGVNESTDTDVFRTHAGVFVVSDEPEEEAASRKYFYYEPTTPLPDHTYRPLFISSLAALPLCKTVKVVFGRQLEENDCLQRCFSFISDVAANSVEWAKYVGMEFECGKKDQPQLCNNNVTLYKY